MTRKQPLGPFCQSCGMPLEKTRDFGTDLTGLRVNDYCHWCFSDGVFTEPEISLPDMIDKCVGIMAKKKIMPEVQARALIANVLPKLKRWRAA